MMVSGHNWSKTDKVKRFRRICDETGGCSFCKPHRGENSRHGQINTKPKAKK